MASPRIFTENECGWFMKKIFGPELVDFANYQLQLTVIYTEGKDVHWAKFPEAKTASGVMAGAFLIPKTRIAAGGTIIDLKACTVAARTGGLVVGVGGRPTTFSPNRVSLGSLRYGVLSVLAHEMFHMIQNWRGGNSYDGNELLTPANRRYSETFYRLMKQIERSNPKKAIDYIKAASHARHPEEQAAERLAKGRLKRFRTAIEGGDWDLCLPIDILKTYIR